MAYHGLGWLSGSDGSYALCCPFDARRNGFVLGEGAAMLLLEDVQRAEQRNATIAARVLGYGSSFDPLPSLSSFDDAGGGLEAAVREALLQACLSPQDIDCILSSANSSPGLDRMEARVIDRVFAERTRALPVTSIKSMIGETCSVSGALALAAAVGCLERGLVPPTVNCRDRDPDCRIAVVTDGAQPQALGNVLVLAVDACGPNTAVILGKGGRP